MALYLLLFPLNLLVSLLCYITNPIVILFCNEENELPGFLRMWQPWDDSCCPSDVKDFVPKAFLFDWDRHYEEYRSTTVELAALGRERCFCRLVDPHFTRKEKIKRYICRLLWLTRNCGYGFAFWLFGRTIKENTVETINQIVDSDGKKTYARVKGTSKWLAPFLYKNDRAIVPGFLRWCVFFGWKIDYSSNLTHRAMIAGRLAVRFGRE